MDNKSKRQGDEQEQAEMTGEELPLGRSEWGDGAVGGTRTQKGTLEHRRILPSDRGLSSAGKCLLGIRLANGHCKTDQNSGSLFSQT